MSLRDQLVDALQAIRKDFHKGRRYRLRSAQTLRAQASVAIEALIEQLEIEARDERDRETMCGLHGVPFLAGACVGCRFGVPSGRSGVVVPIKSTVVG